MVSVAPRMEGVTIEDFTDYPEYTATTQAGVFENLVKFGLGNVTGGERETTFSGLLDKRLDDTA